MKPFFIFLLCVFVSQWSFSQQDIFELARRGTVEEMKAMLKENPLAVNAVNNDGYGLLVLATYKGNNPVARFLIENGADINGTSKYGSPLMAAVVKGNNDIAKLLLEHHADTNSADLSGNTALIYAVIFKKYDLVEMLVNAKANVSWKDIRGNSAVDYAKMANDEKLLQLLKK